MYGMNYGQMNQGGMVHSQMSRPCCPPPMCHPQPVCCPPIAPVAGGLGGGVGVAIIAVAILILIALGVIF